MIDTELRIILKNRFVRNNIPKYLKYADEWVDNVIINKSAYNIDYFIKEWYFINKKQNA